MNTTTVVIAEAHRDDAHVGIVCDVKSSHDGIHLDVWAVAAHFDLRLDVVDWDDDETGFKLLGIHGSQESLEHYAAQQSRVLWNMVRVIDGRTVGIPEHKRRYLDSVVFQGYAVDHACVRFGVIVRRKMWIATMSFVSRATWWYLPNLDTLDAIRDETVVEALKDLVGSHKGARDLFMMKESTS